MLILDFITLLVASLISIGLYPVLIRCLTRLRMGQVIQPELGRDHQAKAGTPTAGGALFVALAVVGGLLATHAGHPGAAPVTLAVLLFGLLGLVDDVAKRRLGAAGLRARWKLPLQALLALPILAAAHGPQHLLAGGSVWAVWALGVVAIVGAANAVNLTDGSDGLAGSSWAVVAVGLLLLLSGAPTGERAVGMTLAGGVVGFVVYNRYPARIFMGDAGSLALGAALAAMAIEQGWLLLLPLLGLVFVFETLSVIIQVTFFKVSGGRRVFRMTPIHLTFQLAGWSENRIALAFGGVAAASVLASLALSRVLV